MMQQKQSNPDIVERIADDHHHMCTIHGGENCNCGTDAARRSIKNRDPETIPWWEVMD